MNPLSLPTESLTLAQITGTAELAPWLCYTAFVTLPTKLLIYNLHETELDHILLVPGTAEQGPPMMHSLGGEGGACLSKTTTVPKLEYHWHKKNT